MDLVPIETVCPVCGESDVAYTCAPACCFNHACAACRASWQLGTELSTANAPAVAAPAGEYDTTFPTAPCVRCGDLVWQIAGRRELWCPSCRIVLNWTTHDVRPFAARG